eukprot:gene18664-20547_t
MNTRTISYRGLPIDNSTKLASSPAKFIIKSDLKGSVRFVVNKWLSLNDIKIKVKLDGWTNTNLTVFRVEYARIGKYKDTIQLLVYEPPLFKPAVKLNKNSLTFIIATGSTCLAIILLSIIASSGVHFYKKYKKKASLRGYFAMDQEESSNVYDSIESYSSDSSKNTSTSSSSNTTACDYSSDTTTSACSCASKATKEGNTSKEDHESSSDAERDCTKEDDDGCKEHDHFKDDGEDSKEDHHDSKEDHGSKEDHNSKEDHDSKEDHGSKEDHDSKENDSKQDGFSEDDDRNSKEDRNHSKEDINNAKEDVDSKDSNVSFQKDISKEEQIQGFDSRDSEEDHRKNCHAPDIKLSASNSNEISINTEDGSDSPGLLHAPVTRTINGSNVLITSDSVRKADIVSGDHSSCYLLQCSSNKDMDLVSGDNHAVESVISEAIRAQTDFDGGLSGETKNETGLERSKNAQPIKKPRGRKSLSPSNNLLFCLFFVTMISASQSSSSSPDVNFFQTETADITIELPDIYLSDVHVFFNQLHSNPVLVSGDQHVFNLKVFDVASVMPAASAKDKCKEKKTQPSCDTGICEPLTGNCLCQRGQTYDASSHKCRPDCTRECPAGFYMAKQCTKLKPGTCKPCKPACGAGKYEFTPCGGAFDRECRDLSTLPDVIIKGDILSENRLKANGTNRTVTFDDDVNRSPETVVDRGTGLKLTIKLLNANLDVLVGEIRRKNYDRNPSVRDFCSQHVPDYYVGRRSVADRMFYFRTQGKDQCPNANPHLLKGAVHCLGSDHDLIRMFSVSKSQNEADAKFVEKSGLCRTTLQQCLDCRKQCVVGIDKQNCWQGESVCFANCETKRCLCRNNNCPCYRYKASNCYEKKTKCVGRKVNVVTLRPIFNDKFAHCSVKLLRLASYKLHVTVHVNGTFVGKKDLVTSSVEHDFGYMKVIAPDMSRIKTKKHLLLRKNMITSGIDIGYFASHAVPFTGVNADSMAFAANTPMAVNDMMWRKSKCKDINSTLLTAFDRFPLSAKSPGIFRLLNKLPVKKLAKGEGQVNHAGGDVFSIRNKTLRQRITYHVYKHKSVLGHFYPRAAILNDNSLESRLVNRSSYHAIELRGRLASCPAFFTVKLFNQDNPREILHHYDIVVMRPDSCPFEMHFNVPFKNDPHRLDTAFILQLTSSQQTIKLVIVHDKKMTRNFNTTIRLPKSEPSKLANILTPIGTVAAGFILLLMVLLLFGFLTRPKDKQNQGDRDNELHFRHVFMITWYVGARLAKSLLFTIVFLNYLFTVIHSENYYTLTSFKKFQTREHSVFKGIYADMEKHRVAEIDRQQRALVEEKNLCDMKMQELDEYLAQHRKEASLKQRLEMRAKSIKKNALDRIERNLAAAEAQFDRMRNKFNGQLDSRMEQLRQEADSVEGKVTSHSMADPARGLYKMYRAFGGSKSFAQYIGLDVRFHINYKHSIGVIKQGVVDLRRKVAQLKSTNDNEKRQQQREEKAIEKAKKVLRMALKIKRIRYPSAKIKLEFDDEQARNVFALSWITKLMKDKVVAKVATGLVVAFDVLFFVYRHTRTYAMAVMMVYGFKKYCDLDELETERLKREERRQRRQNATIVTSSSADDLSSDESSVVFDRRHIESTGKSRTDLTGDYSESGCLSSDTREFSPPGTSDVRTSTSAIALEQGAVNEVSANFSRPENSSAKNEMSEDSCQHQEHGKGSGPFKDEAKTDGLDIKGEGKFSGISSQDESDAAALQCPGSNGTNIEPMSTDKEVFGIGILRSEDYGTACSETISHIGQSGEDCGKEMETRNEATSLHVSTSTGNEASDEESSTSTTSTLRGSSSSVEELYEDAVESEGRRFTAHDGHLYEEVDQDGYLLPQQCKQKKSANVAKEANNMAMSAIGVLGGILLKFVTQMKKLNIVHVILLKTHLIPLFILICFVVVAIYCVIVTAKFVLHTPILDEVGFFDLKISPIVTYRKVVNTRTSAHAFMINHVHIPYYEARINARINVYRFKAKLHKKLQCLRSVLHNTEYCSWPSGQCDGLKSYDEGFLKNITKFKCHMRPAIARRYTEMLVHQCYATKLQPTLYAVIVNNSFN